MKIDQYVLHEMQLNMMMKAKAELLYGTARSVKYDFGNGIASHEGYTLYKGFSTKNNVLHFIIAKTSDVESSNRCRLIGFIPTIEFTMFDSVYEYDRWFSDVSLVPIELVNNLIMKYKL